MAVSMSFIGGAGWQFFDDSGDPLSGGKIFTYAAGTTTPLTTYTSRDGLTPNTNPIILDAAGRTPQEIWATEGLLYKYVVKTSTDTLIRTYDNIGGSVVASDLAQDLANTTNPAKGDALIGFKQSNASGFLTGAVARTVNDKLQEFVSVKDFGAVGDGIADDTAAIQAALNSFTGYFGTVMLPSNGTYRITSPISLRRGHNLVGDGSPEIVADFSSANWAGDYVALKFIVDVTSVGNAALQAGYGQKSFGFRLSGANNSGVISYGMRFYTDQTISVSSAVQYSYLWGTIENINIRRFDTALWIQECWNSFFNNVVVTYCRRGINIEGKSVNVTFMGMQVQNPENTYTSSTDPTYGIVVQSGFHYAGSAEGRPEGLSFIGGLVYGCVHNLYLQNSLQLSFETMIVDGASDSAVVIVGPDSATLRDCYFFTVKNGGACVEFKPVAASTAASILIDNCKFVGYDGTQIGVSFANGGAARKNVQITNNACVNLSRFISAINAPDNSLFYGNYAEFHYGTEMIYVQTGGEYTIIDANTCSTINVNPLRCHPSTSARLSVGNNASPTFVTQYSGKVTIPAGNTSADLPNYFWTSPDMYIRPITHATPNGNAGSWYIQENYSQSMSRIRLGAPLGADIDVRYTVTAITYLASI